nr:hypothetical protein [Mycoplasmopsis bovis]
MKKFKWIYTYAGLVISSSSLSFTTSCFEKGSSKENNQKIVKSNSTDRTVNKPQRKKKKHNLILAEAMHQNTQATLKT